MVGQATRIQVLLVVQTAVAVAVVQGRLEAPRAEVE
jgi:hypothetical protein